jgi:hypothetical protein
LTGLSADCSGQGFLILVRRSICVAKPDFLQL